MAAAPALPAATESYYRCIHANGVGIRKEASETAGRIQGPLKGEIVTVSAVVKGSNGVTYLKLADGRGFCPLALDGIGMIFNAATAEEAAPTTWPKYNGKCIPQDANAPAPGGWTTCDVSQFQLRGPNYLTDKVKQPSKPAMFETESLDVVQSKTVLQHVALRLTPMRKYLQGMAQSHPKRFFFIINRAVPVSADADGNPQFRNQISVYRRDLGKVTDAAFDTMWQRFVAGDGAFRDNRLKYCFQFENAPFFVRAAVTAVGAMRPVVMGRGYLAQLHFTGPNYVEVDVDIGSSVVANQVAGSVLGYSSSFAIKELFVLEGQANEELPERALCAHIVRNVDTVKLAAPLRPGDYISAEMAAQLQEESKSADPEADAAATKALVG